VREINKDLIFSIILVTIFIGIVLIFTSRINSPVTEHIKKTNPEKYFKELFDTAAETESMDPTMVSGLIEIYTPSGRYYVINRGSGIQITCRVCNREEAIDILLGRLIQNNIYIKSKEDYVAARKVLENSTKEEITEYYKPFVGASVSIKDIPTHPSDDKLEGRINFGSIALRGKKWIEDNLNTP